MPESLMLDSRQVCWNKGTNFPLPGNLCLRHLNKVRGAVGSQLVERAHAAGSLAQNHKNRGNCGPTFPDYLH